MQMSSVFHILLVAFALFQGGLTQVFSPVSGGFEATTPLPCSLIWCSPSCLTFSCRSSTCVNTFTCRCTTCPAATVTTTVATTAATTVGAAITVSSSVFKPTATGLQATTSLPCSLIWCFPSCVALSCQSATCTSAFTCSCTCQATTTIPTTTTTTRTTTTPTTTTTTPTTTTITPTTTPTTPTTTPTTPTTTPTTPTTTPTTPTTTSTTPRTTTRPSLIPVFTPNPTGFVGVVPNLPCSTVWCSPSCNFLGCSTASCYNSTACQCSMCPTTAAPTTTPSESFIQVACDSSVSTSCVSICPTGQCSQCFGIGCYCFVCPTTTPLPTTTLAPELLIPASCDISNRPASCISTCGAVSPAYSSYCLADVSGGCYCYK